MESISADESDKIQLFERISAAESNKIREIYASETDQMKSNYLNKLQQPSIL